MTPEQPNSRKSEDIDLCARALFEQYKNSGIPELAMREWEALPEHVDDFHPEGKSFYRREVQLSVETLWRAGRLV